MRNLKYVNGSSTRTKEAGFLGISSKVHRYYETLPVTGVPGQIGSQLKLGVQALGRYPEKIASLYRTVFDKIAAKYGGSAAQPRGLVDDRLPRYRTASASRRMPTCTGSVAGENLRALVR